MELAAHMNEYIRRHGEKCDPGEDGSKQQKKKNHTDCSNLNSQALTFNSPTVADLLL